MNREEIPELKAYIETLDFVHHVGQITGLGGANGECTQIEAFVTDTSIEVHQKFADHVKAGYPKLKLWSQIVQYREIKSEEERAKETDKTEKKKCCGSCS